MKNYFVQQQTEQRVIPTKKICFREVRVDGVIRTAQCSLN